VVVTVPGVRAYMTESGFKFTPKERRKTPKGYRRSLLEPAQEAPAIVAPGGPTSGTLDPEGTGTGQITC